MAKDFWKVLGLSVGAVAAFEIAYEIPTLACLMVGFLFCLVELTRTGTPRRAFWLGLAIGVAACAPQLFFFWGIFGVAGLALWMVAGVWIAVFLLLTRLCAQMFPRWAAILLLPVLWTGLEYFRSELYYLKFSWLSVGFAFSGTPVMEKAGVYGLGFLLMAAVAGMQFLRWKWRLLAVVVVVTGVGAGCLWQGGAPRPVAENGPRVVGIQTEGMNEREIVTVLDQAVAEHPEAEVAVLSEYAFGAEVPTAVMKWCANNHRYLVAGGIKAVGTEGAFRDTAFVIGPEGRMIFSQAKSVPIQFFADGLPAEGQRLWQSPWGKIGICICYDLSYSRVTDRLVAMGAEGLIVPTMDALSWGSHEHRLHARVAPARAAEYGVGILRVGSSGISQLVGPDGVVTATAEFPGVGKMVAGRLVMRPGRLPVDRTGAPICVALVGIVAAGLAGLKARKWWRKRFMKDAAAANV